MFRSACIRLTFWYLLIILALSATFSVALYRVSVDELNHSLDRQTVLLRTPPYMTRMPDLDDINRIRQEQIDESRLRIIYNLIYFNVSVLILGGVISYLLARRTLQPIEEALEAQNRFTADASHELRTPLTSMKTEIEVALRDEGLSVAESKELLRSNLEEIAHLEALSSSLLKLAGQAGTLTPDLIQSCSLHDVVAKAISDVSAKAQAAQIEIVDKVQENAMMDGEPWSLTELMTILLDNAIKYGKPDTKVRVFAYTEGKFAHFVIRDSGIGIKASDLPHIFERFYRVDSSRSKKRVEGYGLGLSIAKRIVDMHHGKIEVESKIGTGSVFSVKIPLEQPRSILSQPL